MSFKVNWNSLETDSLTNWTKELLTDALNSGKRPNILASSIQIKDLNFGKIAPNFEILEIGELDKDRFRGIFKINYNGDFHLTLHTKVQANPLKIYSSNSLEREVSIEKDSFITPNFMLSNDPFALPLDLKLSDIKISGIGIIVFSKSKGLTLVFRNDPLDSIKVSSTFDTVQVLANFLQKQIENQIRDLFRETLPTLIHQLSLKYTSINQNDLLNLHSKLTKNYESTLIDINLIYSSNHLQRNLNLFNSRETLKLNIPKFKNIIQRTHLDKFNKSLPNLFNSLNLNLNLFDSNLPLANNNGIPIDLLINGDVREVDNILNEISSIQSNNYYKSNNNAPKPKRRIIKFNRKKNKNHEVSGGLSRSTSIQSDTPSDVSTLVDEPVPISTTDSVDLKQPQPIRVSNDLYSELMKPIHSHSHFQPHHLNSPSSNSSLLSGLGIGNNYFNFTNAQQISTSPIRKETEKQIKSKKSNNYIDINKIKDHTYTDQYSKSLKNFKLNEANDLQNNLFEVPPPPYYQV